MQEPGSVGSRDKSSQAALGLLGMFDVYISDTPFRDKALASRASK